MSDEVTRQATEASADRNVDRESYDWMVRDRDNWRQHAEGAERALAVDASTIQRLTEEVHRLKDTGEQLIAECNRVSAERDAARAEAEGLRADALAHPPELHHQLAIERKRHLELMEDFDRQAVMIGVLEDAVKRAENALATAQAKRADPRIPGYVATIAQLASQIEGLLS